jgi:hypothetical protein
LRVFFNANLAEFIELMSLHTRPKIRIMEDLAAQPNARVPQATGDEADIYDLFALPPRLGSDFLIGSAHKRSVKRQDEASEVEALQEAIRQTPPCGQLTLEFRRNPERCPSAGKVNAPKSHPPCATSETSSQRQCCEACQCAGDSGTRRERECTSQV